MADADLLAFIRTIEKALSALGYATTPLRIERWALLVHRAMSGQSRSFHRPDHVVELSRGADPLETLAALFHDLVYLQVDAGVPRHLEPVLAPYLDLEHGEPVVRAIPGAPSAALLCFRLFGVSSGDQVVKVTGVNELMSALVAAVTLSELMPLPQLAPILACIEATIPFREADASGLGPFDRLEARLRAANTELQLGLDAEAIQKAMERAVWVANQDVANFAEPHVEHFLENTWRLLPEGNPSLRNHELYTAGEYRVALQKMEGFMASLQAERIFHQYRGTPSAAEHRALTERARRNLEVATRYLRLKLLAIAHIEALARATGGDAPLELFMGGLHPGESRERLEQHLPASTGSAADCDAEVLALLVGGRSGTSGFDLQQAPVAAFLYRQLGEARCAELFVAARSLFSGALEPRAFLATQDRASVAALATAAAEVAITRRDALRALAQEL